MYWKVNDGSYNRFQKWQLKCENILDCELVMLSEPRKCKKVLAWSGDFGLNQYVSWNISSEELTLEIIWKKFEEFCKPQANELRARFDLLTSFKQGDLSIDQWYNAVQTQVALANYPQETTQILQRNIFWLFLNDESFVSKTPNDGHVELSKYPASKLRQVAKKFESSQATAKHMKQITRDMQAVQVNLLQHQCTELPPSKSMRQKKKKPLKCRQDATKHNEDKRKPQQRKMFDTEHPDRCHKCGDSHHREGFRCPASKYQCKICKKIGHFSSLCYKKKEQSDYYQRSLRSSSSKAQ